MTTATEFDRFQTLLLDTVKAAAPEDIGAFVARGYLPFHKFLIRLFISHLKPHHPLRARAPDLDPSLTTEAEQAIYDDFSSCFMPDASDMESPLTTQNHHNIDVDSIISANPSNSASSASSVSSTPTISIPPNHVSSVSSPVLPNNSANNANNANNNKNLPQSSTNEATTKTASVLATIDKYSKNLATHGGFVDVGASAKRIKKTRKNATKKKKQAAVAKSREELTRHESFAGIEELTNYLATMSSNSSPYGMHPIHGHANSGPQTFGAMAYQAQNGANSAANTASGAYNNYASSITALATKAAKRQTNVLNRHSPAAYAVSLLAADAANGDGAAAGGEDLKMEEMGNLELSNTMRDRLQSRKESIWAGLMDVNSVIIVPETPKHRSMTFEEVSFLNATLLDSIVDILSYSQKKRGVLASMTSKQEVPELFAHISRRASIESCCLYLPLLMIISLKLSNKKWREKLQISIFQRATDSPDIKQCFEFFLNSYRDVSDVSKMVQNTDMGKMLASQDNSNNSNNSSNNSNDGTDSNEPSRMVSFTHMDPSDPNSMLNHVNSVTSMNSLHTSGDVTPVPSDPEQSVTLAGAMGPMGTISPPNGSVSNAAPQFIEQEQSQSGWTLFGSILSRKLSSGSEIALHYNSMVRDPINYEGPPLSRIKVRKVIASNSKPLLLDCYVRVQGQNGMEYPSSTIILKKGDDLRRDAAILATFRYMNKVWRDAKLMYKNVVPVEILTYKCVAMGSDYGILELIQGCIPLRMIDVLHDDMNAIKQFNLVATAAASYIASFVMGIRDRHFDNVLIRKSDFTLFHIDFGYLLGQKTSLDTSKLAVTKELKNLLGKCWDEFVELGVEAYMNLRKHSSELKKFAALSFAYLFNEKQVEKFLDQQLHVNDMNDEQARKYMEKKLKDSPGSLRTKAKNVVHAVATLKK